MGQNVLLLGMVSLLCLEHAAIRKHLRWVQGVFWATLLFWLYQMPQADIFVMRLASVVGVLTACSPLLMHSWFKRRSPPGFVYICYLAAMYGFGWVLVSSSYLSLFVGAELVSWAVFLSLWYDCSETDVLFQYGLRQILGSLCFMGACVLLSAAAQSVVVVPSIASSAAASYALCCWLLGVMIKTGTAPMHTLIGQLYEDVAPPLWACSGVMVKLTVVVMAWRLMPLFQSDPLLWAVLCVFCALVSWGIGHLQAYTQTRLVHLMNAAGSAHMGWVYFAWAMASNLSMRWACAWMLVYACVWYLWVGLMAHLRYQNRELRWLEELSGLMQIPRSTYVLFALVVGICVLMDIPPLLGFSLKFRILMAIDQPLLAWVALLGLCAQITALAYYARILYHAMMRMHYYEIERLDPRGTVLAAVLACMLVAWSYVPLFVYIFM